MISHPEWAWRNGTIYNSDKMRLGANWLINKLCTVSDFNFQ